MVNEIALIGWANDIGAYLIMQYPRKLIMITQDVMQIYTAHRQNTLYPNFATLNYKEKKFASFFSGMQTTEYAGAPNFIVALITSEESEESLNLLHEVLPNISTTLLTTLFEGYQKY
jgi:hypothetical protein